MFYYSFFPFDVCHLSLPVPLVTAYKVNKEGKDSGAVQLLLM